MATTQKNNAERTPPTPPEDWECCGSECGDACIHELYHREKQEYDAWLKQHNQHNNKSAGCFCRTK
ncbi:oxidoreductase-like domain-containing protein [Kingella kingae]|uniref:oxidoreductase-like domain-containing protein n=1 Tax=Kingella kingae TaxID=504 RepID=UPI0009B7676C|nr:oxidoreductase-like domain-containing protein [Kingella kingae]